MVKGYRLRRANVREQRRTLVIVCEGQKTERIYFEKYRERNSGLIIFIPNSTVTDPENLVGIALHQIRKYDLDLDNGDQVWCVFDADHHTNQEIEKAIRNAGDKVNICLSNPSFELWYLLHFCYYDSRISNNDLMHKIKEHIPNYSKNKCCFDQLLEKRQDAINNAKRLNQLHERNNVELLSTNSNPSTQVFRLVEYILETIAKNKTNR